MFLSKEKIIEIILNSTRVEQKFVQKSEMPSSLKNDVLNDELVVKIIQLENEIAFLKRQHDDLSDAQVNIIVDRVLECLSLNENELSGFSVATGSQFPAKYPPAITKSGFPNNLSSEKGDNYFCFLNINASEAEFEYCGDDFERAKANKTELEIACEISGTTFETKKIVNVEKGRVSLHDSKWVITKKAKIKFE